MRILRPGVNEACAAGRRTLRVATRAGLTGLALIAASLPGTTGAQTPPAATAATDVLEEVTVTARKKDETALNVPLSITAFSEVNLEKLNINSFTDYATKTPNMSFSYGTANWGYVDSHTIAVRGISGFGTTGVYIDETPIPDSLDPRVVDIARIEILKGPQGTLFGQSSLGGNLRLITVQPTPGNDNIHYSAKVGGTSGAGSPDYGLDFAGSHTLIDDTLVVRAVGFYDHEGGFLHRVAVDPTTGTQLADTNNYGAQKSYGGSLALRWLAGDRFESTLRIMAQNSESDGWSAPYAPLPNFAIQNLTMDRTNDVQERARDRFYLPSLQLNYKGNGYSLHESLSYFDRRGTQVEDGSEGTRDALDFYWAFLGPPYNGISQLSNNYTGNNVIGSGAINEPFGWQETVSYRRSTSETRISFDKTSFGLSGVAGVYLSRSFSDTYLNGGVSPLIASLGLNTNAASNAAQAGSGFPGPYNGYCRNAANPNDMSCSTYGTGLVWESWQPSYHRDEAAFGELYYEFAKFELTAGGRAYRQTQTTYEFEAGALNYSELNIQAPDTKQSGFNPKLALKYNFDQNSMVYASFSKGFRAGGAGVPLPLAPAAFLNAIHQQANAPTTYDSDYVKNYEIGGKISTAGGKVVVTAAAFQMDWSNIQQFVIAPISYITLIVNAGEARVRGGELEVDAKPMRGVDLHAGVGYEDAKITNGALYWQPTGAAVYNTPKVTANGSATFTVPVTSELSSFLTIDGSYTGGSYSGTAGCQLNVGPNQLAEYPNGFQFFPCPTVGPGTLQGAPIYRGSYYVLNARVGLSWGRSELALTAQNLTNSRPNLGDFNPESYAKHSLDPAAFDANYGVGYIVPRVATLRPFSAALVFRQRF